MKIKKWMILPTAYAFLETVALLKKGDSVYRNQPEERNPFQGKMVKFVFDINDEENADGERGHLIPVGNSVMPKSIYISYVKPGFDKVLSFAGLVVLAPVYAAISLAIVIDDPGPVLFTQKRVGKDKEFFKLHKFRSMKMSTPHDVPTHMLENPDQYITKVGSILRKLSLDELPQIWDIFIGNMSVVGPRPALWNQDVLTAKRDNYCVNDYRPGLTGFAQINGRDELEISEKAKLDGQYISSISFLSDLKIFFNSIGVFKGDNNVVEGKRRYDDKLVSIITPSYNSEEYIKYTIASVQKQTYPHWEMIIVDDCSSDNSFQIAELYSKKDNRIKVFKNESNKGVAYTRNVGLSKARGRFIAFVDSDDLWSPFKLERQLSYMKDNSYFFTYTNYQIFNDSTGYKGKIVCGPKVMNANDVLKNTAIGCLTVMVDRVQVGEFSMPLIDHMEDNATWYNILKKGHKAYRLDEVLSYYRDRSNSLSSNKINAAISQWSVYRNYFSFSFVRSLWYFSNYASNAILKHYL